MNGRLLLAFAVVWLGACSTEARVAMQRDTEIQLETARAGAAVICSARADCDRIWDMTKRYVSQRSVTPIRRADDAVIETAEPHSFGAVYVWAVRTTDPSGLSTIRIKGMCRGMYNADGDPGWLYTRCAQQVQAVETDFRAFVGAGA